MAGRLAVLGCGNMGQAIVRGLLESGWTTRDRVTATTLRPERAKMVTQTLGIACGTDNAAAIRDADLVLLAVKPQALAACLEQVQDAIGPGMLILSIAAGKHTASIERFTGEAPVVRAMPNLPVTVGMGATALCAGSHAGPDHVAKARQVFESVGTVEEVPEHLMDAVTGLSGTGPMYVFHVLEALADAGVKTGLSRDVATRLAVQTLRGSALLAEKSGVHPAALKDRVTSPGGTAITALHVLRRSAFDAILMDAVEAATWRSRQLGD